MIRRRRAGAGERGQVIVVFALALVALMAAAGLAFDVGRFYSEKRFLQNAADAAALAAANSLIRGNTTSQADTDARAVLTRNFANDPTGSNPQLPPTSPVYAAGHAGDPVYLVNGILISGGDIRVAIQSSVGYTFGRAVGLGSSTIGAQARARTSGSVLPIAVRHYVNAPGPNTTPTTPCNPAGSDFQDLVSTADTSCLGSDSNAALRTTPSPGMNFDASNPSNDTAHHGPIISIVGQGAAPSNNASFRGFVALDIRDFANSTSNVFYNGVTAGTQPNVLKSLESGWVAKGYPGPAFPAVISPPDPNDQVGLMDGNAAGLVVSAVQARFVPGDEVLCAVYSGTTMTIPDFTFTVPSAVAINTTQNRNGSVTMTVAKNNAFTGQVSTTAFADWGDPTNPLATGRLAPLTFSPDPNTPPTTITWTTFSTTAAPVGISTFWIKGHSSSPYLTDHYYPVALNVGAVVRDFSSTGNGQVFSMAATGQTASGSITFSTPNNNSTYFGGSVTLSVEGGPDANGVLPVGIGTISLSSTTADLSSKGASQSINLSINGGSLGPGEYPLTIRATGTNSDGKTVTHQVPILLDIATAGTSNEYVDIQGFAVFRITAITSNDVDAYAISGVYADMNDPALSRGQTARLVPWS